MKRGLKVIGSVILLLLLAFFAAGLIFPKVKYETVITIDRPLDTVFALFNDTSKLQEWMPTIKSIEQISGTSGAIGSIIKITTVNQGNVFEVMETLNEFIRNEKVSLQMEVGNMMKNNTFLFSSEGDQTKIVHKTIAQGTNYINRCISAFFKSMFKKIDRENLASFKKFAESN